MKRTPLKRGKPLRPKAKPRRNSGRINHGRIGGPKNPNPTAEQRRFWQWLREEKGCVITGQKQQGQSGRPAITIHHVTSDGYKRVARDHWIVIPLRADLHQTVWNNTDSIEAIGHRRFAELYTERLSGLSVLEFALRLKQEWLNS